MPRSLTQVALSLLLALCWGANAGAAYKDDIGFTQLQTELGSSTPTGAGVWVSQIEAESGGANYYMPTVSHSQFTGKTFYYTTYPYYYSSHATSVGQYFYGNSGSIAPGITSIINYNAGYWLGGAYLNTTGGIQPYSTPSRVGNHSWVGSAGTLALNSEILRRLDWVINRDEFIHLTAMNNGGGAAAEPLLGSSFNGIAVGLSSGASKHGSYALDSPYVAGRTRPDLVAPMSATSSATPVAASASALLVEVGHAGGTTLSTDPAVKSTTNRNGDTIYNAERSEVVKAALMAGASRTAAQLTLGYTVNTANGLNDVYGAGQLNVYNSYHVIAAGEQNSLQDAPAGQGAIGGYGFDYDPYFGGQSGSNRTASYYFRTAGAGSLTASLVWNLAVDGGAPENFDGDAILYNLGLYLYDLTNNQLVGSAAGLVDNTENLWLTLYANRDYLLQVSALTGDNFLWDYGLAWNIAAELAPVPLPGAVYLLGSGLLALLGCRRKWRN
jgi:hypothetical protein